MGLSTWNKSCATSLTSHWLDQAGHCPGFSFAHIPHQSLVHWLAKPRASKPTRNRPGNPPRFAGRSTLRAWRGLIGPDRRAVPTIGRARMPSAHAAATTLAAKPMALPCPSLARQSTMPFGLPDCPTLPRGTFPAALAHGGPWHAPCKAASGKPTIMAAVCRAWHAACATQWVCQPDLQRTARHWHGTCPCTGRTTGFSPTLAQICAAFETSLSLH